MTLDQTASAGISNLKMIIGGQSVDAADGQTFEVVNPATGSVIASAPLGGKTDVDRAAGWANQGRQAQ